MGHALAGVFLSSKEPRPGRAPAGLPFEVIKMQDMQEDEEMQAILTLIGRNVAAKRQALGLSQREVAQAAGVSRDTLSSIEQGKHNFRYKTIEAIAHALDTTFPELIKEQLP